MPVVPQNVEALLEQIRRDGIAKVCSVFRRPPLPSRMLRELVEMEGEDGVLGRRFVADYPLSPSDLLEALDRDCEDSIALASVALNPRVPPHVLARLAESEDSAVRRQAARNSQLAPRDLRTLARDVDWRVRAAAAGNNALKTQHQAELTHDPEPAVRLSLVGNPSIVPEIRFALSNDPSPVVRGGMVGACDDDEALLFWADSDIEDFQTALLTRKDLPEAVIESLMQSPFARIRAAARERRVPNEEEVLGLARRDEVEDRLWILGQATVPLPIQQILAQDADASVRVALAAHSSVQPDVAEHFITMNDEGCCRELAANPAMPKELMMALACSKIEGIAVRLAYRDDVPNDVVRYLLSGPDGECFIAHLAMRDSIGFEIPGELMVRFCDSPQPAVRALVAQLGHLSDSLRAQLRADPVPAVRIALCKNSETTDMELEEMLEDGDEVVVENARLRWMSNRRYSPSEDEILDEASAQTEQEPTQANPDEPIGLIGSLKRILN